MGELLSPRENAGSSDSLDSLSIRTSLGEGRCGSSRTTQLVPVEGLLGPGHCVGLG